MTQIVLVLIAVGLLTAGCSSNSLSTSTKPVELRPVRIVLVGASTVATYTPEQVKVGWGQMLPEFLAPQATVVNLAKGGRSSKSFITEGLWDKALLEHPDFVLIHFAHNDCPGKGERSTDPKGDYQTYLRRYVDDSRAHGAVPVLVTSVTRRNFDREGRIRNDVLPYADAMKQVARERNVPLVDLNAASVALLEKLGDQGSAYISVSADDHTHLSAAGARVMAEIIARGLKDHGPPLAPYVRLPAP